MRSEYCSCLLANRQGERLFPFSQPLHFGRDVQRKLVINSLTKNMLGKIYWMKEEQIFTKQTLNDTRVFSPRSSFSDKN